MEKYYFFLKVLVKSQQTVHKQYVHFASIKITKYKRADPFTQNEPAPFCYLCFSVSTSESLTKSSIERHSPLTVSG